MSGRIAVVGAGAVGGWLAARLALAGHEVMALGSRGPIDALTVSEGGGTLTARFMRFDGAADVALIAVKAPALAAAVATARSFIGPATTVVPLLNGVAWWFTPEPLAAVDPDGGISAAIPLAQLVGSVVHAATSRAGDTITVKHVDRLILGELDGAISDRVAGLCDLFEGVGIRCDASANIRRDIWYKLWGNATINPLSALTLATADRLLAECKPFLLAGMAELARLGAAIGCPIEESGEDRMAVTARLGAFKTSMLQDVEAGRPIELEALLGAPIELAHRSGVPVPTLESLYAMTRLMAESRGLL